jgi:hypothetical protein
MKLRVLRITSPHANGLVDQNSQAGDCKVEAGRMSFHRKLLEASRRLSVVEAARRYFFRPTRRPQAQCWGEIDDKIIGEKRFPLHS